VLTTKLSKNEHPLLRKNSKTHDYSLIDPRYAMCIRIALYENSGIIIKKSFDRY